MLELGASSCLINKSLVAGAQVSLAASAGASVAIPTDRAHDGIDLSAVLLEGSDEGHVTLFHPHSHGNGTDAVPAMRYKQ